MTVDQHAAVSTVTVEHPFLDDGDFPIAVSVTDDDGGTDDDGVTATVVNVPPSVSATGDSIDEGQGATVVATFVDPGVLDTHRRDRLG